MKVMTAFWDQEDSTVQRVLVAMPAGLSIVRYSFWMIGKILVPRPGRVKSEIPSNAI